MKIGVFDSGVGGETIAISLAATFPQAQIISANDRAHMPYGDKSADEIITLTKAAIRPLIEAKCDVIVLACNTATAIAITTLRKTYPLQKFVGIEPMIKTAAKLTKSNIVAVCATPATLASRRYKELIAQYGMDLRIIQPDCSPWAYWIEHNKINQHEIEHTITKACDQGADVIVLGCTHYHWIKNLITRLSNGKAHVIEPSEAIGQRIAELLELR